MSDNKNIAAIKVNIINDNKTNNKKYFDFDILCGKKRFKNKIKTKSIKSIIWEYANKIYLQKSYLNIVSYYELFDIYKILIDIYNKKINNSFINVEYVQSMQGYNYKINYMKGMVKFIFLTDVISAAKTFKHNLKLSKIKLIEKQKDFGVITPNRLIKLKFPNTMQSITLLEKFLLPEYYFRGLIFIEIEKQKWITKDY